MNPDTNTPDVNRASGAAVGFAIASVIFLVLVVIVKLSVTPPPIDADRAALISQTLYQIRTNEIVSLSAPGWVDKPRGIVRLPIDRAMQLTEQYWQNPAEGRNELIARSQKAAAPAPAPKPAANQFE